LVAGEREVEESRLLHVKDLDRLIGSHSAPNTISKRDNSDPASSIAG
jgi:hypothetical protein